MAYTPDDGWFTQKHPGFPNECRWCGYDMIVRGKVVVCPQCDEWPAHVKSETRRILREGLD